MRLVKQENFEIKIEDELLLLKPFRKLYNADKSKNKDKFIELISIIYFLIDPRSDYQYILNERERLDEICTSNGYKAKVFTKDELECVELYRKLTTTSGLELLNSTKIAVDKVQEFLKNVDLYALDDKGKPIYTINTITAAIEKVPKLAIALADAEKALAKELEEAGRARGNAGTKSLMDDGILL